MAGINNATINIFCIVLLAILLLNMFHRSGKYLPDQKLFMHMAAMTIILLVLDTLQWVFDGRMGSLPQDVIRISSALYYLIQPLPGVIWCLYVRYQISMDIEETKDGLMLLIIPFALNTVMSVLSYFFEYYFYIDNQNFYHRGEYFWIFVIFAYCYFLYAGIYLHFNRDKIDRHVFNSLILFLLPPVVGGLVQIFHYGMSLTWPCSSLSLVLIYINIQKDQLYTDHLTGLYNRRLLDIHLNSCLRKKRKPGSIGVIMMDIDDFKFINDSFGHVEGDKALIETALILKKSVGKDGFIARYGGDEFVAVVPAKDSSDIKEVADSIERNLKYYNEHSGAPYKIIISMGREIFECGGEVSKLDVLNTIDEKMYSCKPIPSRVTV